MQHAFMELPDYLYLYCNQMVRVLCTRSAFFYCYRLISVDFLRLALQFTLTLPNYKILQSNMNQNQILVKKDNLQFLTMQSEFNRSATI